MPGKYITCLLCCYVARLPACRLGCWLLFAQYLNLSLIAICCSSKTEPLGRAFQRGHKIPEHMGTERPFGIIVGAKVRPSNANEPTQPTIHHPPQRLMWQLQQDLQEQRSRPPMLPQHCR